MNDKSRDYQILRLDREMPKRWRSIPARDDGDFAFENIDTGAVITINSSCRNTQNEGLEKLSKDLFVGVPGNEKRQTKEILIDNTHAMESLVETKPADSYPVKIRAVVLRKSGCTYDLMYIVQSRSFEENLNDFEKFMRGFHAP